MYPLSIRPRLVLTDWSPKTSSASACVCADDSREFYFCARSGVWEHADLSVNRVLVYLLGWRSPFPRCLDETTRLLYSRLLLPPTLLSCCSGEAEVFNRTWKQREILDAKMKKFLSVSPLPLPRFPFPSLLPKTPSSSKKKRKKKRTSESTPE